MGKDYSYGICPYIIKDKTVHVLLNKTSLVSDWNFFKGKKEEDETIFDTAIREFHEETGVMLEGYEELEAYFYQNNKKKFVGIFLVNWENKTTDFEFHYREIFDTAWLDINSNIVTSKNQQKIMDEIKELLLYRVK